MRACRISDADSDARPGRRTSGASHPCSHPKTGSVDLKQRISPISNSKRASELARAHLCICVQLIDEWSMPSTGLMLNAHSHARAQPQPPTHTRALTLLAHTHAQSHAQSRAQPRAHTQARVRCAVPALFRDELLGRRVARHRRAHLRRGPVRAASADRSRFASPACVDFVVATFRIRWSGVSTRLRSSPSSGGARACICSSDLFL